MPWNPVEAPGIESPETSGLCVAESRENVAEDATPGDAKRRDVSATAAADVTMEDADAAIRVAAKVAIDASDYARARALLDLLDVKPAAASVVPLAVKHRPK